MNIVFNRQLPTPQEIKSMYPVPENLAALKKANDEEITIEDKLLINRWHRLSSENKTLIYNMVKALLKGNSQE